MNIYKYEVKKKLISTFIWILSLAVFLFIFYSMFEVMSSNDMRAMLDQFPEAFLKAFGMSDDFSTVLGYTAMVGIYIVLCGAIFSSGLGLNAVHIEERDMTADFLISKPITRNKIMTAKILAALTHILIFTILNSLMCYIGIEAFKGSQDYSFSTFLLMMLGIFIIQVLFFAMGLFISVALKKMSSPLAFSMGLSFGFFILNSFDTILEDTFIKYLIPYDYFEFSYIIKNGAFKAYGLIISLSLIIAFTIGSYLLYNKRNISTAM